MLTDKKGFSLIELLVAIIIFAVAMLGITPLLVGALKKNEENQSKRNAVTILENTASVLAALNYDHPAVGKMVPYWVSGLNGCTPEIDDDNETYTFMKNGNPCYDDKDGDGISDFFDPFNNDTKIPKMYDLNQDDIIILTEIYENSNSGISVMDHPGNRDKEQYFNPDNGSTWFDNQDDCDDACTTADCCVYFPAVTLDNLTSTGLYFNAIDLKETIDGVDYYKAWSVAVLDKYDTKVMGLVVYWWYPNIDPNNIDFDAVKKNYNEVTKLVVKSRSD